jgi:hypothetical protein
MSNAVKARLVKLCIVTHWFRAIPGQVAPPLPRPPPSGRTRNNTSPEISDGMNVIRQPISTRALTDAFHGESLRSGL